MKQRTYVSHDEHRSQRTGQEQIGNSAPPLLARRVAEEVAAVLD